MSDDMRRIIRVTNIITVVTEVPLDDIHYQDTTIEGAITEERHRHTDDIMSDIEVALQLGEYTLERHVSSVVSLLEVTNAIT